MINSLLTHIWDEKELKFCTYCPLENEFTWWLNFVIAHIHGPCQFKIYNITLNMIRQNTG